MDVLASIPLLNPEQTLIPMVEHFQFFIVSEDLKKDALILRGTNFTFCELTVIDLVCDPCLSSVLYYIKNLSHSQ